MGLIPNLELMRNHHNVTQVFLTLKLPHTKSGVKLLRTNFLACPTRMDGPSMPCTGQSGIHDRKSHVHSLF
jgi:hypothetical protein